MTANANCEWRAFGEIDDEVRRKIEALKPKFESGAQFTDEYIWRPGCVVNVKLRKGKLKFKGRVQTTPDGLEMWTVREEVPVDREGIAILERELETSAPRELRKTCRSPQDLKEALSSFDPPLFCIEVTKFRTQYLRELQGVTVSVELAEIQEPAEAGSICIEYEGLDPDKIHSSIFDTLRAVRDELGLPGAMQVKSYLEALEEWAGK